MLLRQLVINISHYFSKLFFALVLASCANSVSERTAKLESLPIAPIFVAQKMSTEEQMICSALKTLNSPTFPSYPMRAAARGQNGWVVARFDVLNGGIKNYHILSSSPVGVFDEVVMEFLRVQRYQPSNSASNCIKVFRFQTPQHHPNDNLKPQ